MITVNYKLKVTNTYNQTFITNIKLNMMDCKKITTLENRLLKHIEKKVNEGILKNNVELIEISINNEVIKRY